MPRTPCLGRSLGIAQYLCGTVACAYRRANISLFVRGRAPRAVGSGGLRMTRTEVVLAVLVVLVIAFLYWSRNVVVRDQSVVTPIYEYDRRVSR